ncbi:glucan endo-1,3-beta-glucosidase 5 [Selaginella moellendorffii]|nr:glucan endo-1,3-beta-glucosidase 5 [Selaginella moellendorffii]XP_024520642.1 glucan endo-1,3-beta-glucosidase 5 [Selaginella moellendorffii]|eukprot:XP_002991155.2 glucan endo-1,3-beta-glucosidase 5 [Selaginella moellendorffii]
MKRNKRNKRNSSLQPTGMISRRSPSLRLQRWWQLLLLCMVWCNSRHSEAAGIGVNWGTMASHRLPNKTVVQMLRANGISKVKLFDADPGVMESLRGTDMELMIAIPNEMLELVATLPAAARNWVRKNVTRYRTAKNGVKIKYVAVGNEPFLKAYNGSYDNLAYPALKNVQDALVSAGLGESIKATIPLNGDVLSNGDSTLPSGGIFRPDIAPQVLKVVEALGEHNAPFVINVYPFLSLQQDPHFPRDFAFFDGTDFPLVDGNLSYTNVFDASYDLLVAALTKAGYSNMTIIIGEIGWPTDGDINANVANAVRFNQAFIRHVLQSGTPLRRPPLEAYLFSLLDEDQKTILPGNFERHWGIFGYDGKAKYRLDLQGSGNVTANLVNASSVKYLPRQWCVLDPSGDIARLGNNMDYACSHSDCTSIVPGSSCDGMGSDAKASYAFNSYYQLYDQLNTSCYFDGLATITKTSPSSGTCQFKIQIATTNSSSTSPRSPGSSGGDSNSNSTSSESSGGSRRNGCYSIRDLLVAASAILIALWKLERF